MITNPFPHAFGIDISDLSIKIVQLKKQYSFNNYPSFTIVVARSVSLPPGLIVNGELVQPEKVRKYLLHLLHGGQKGNQKNIKTPWVVSAIPEIHTFIKQIKINKSPEDIIEEDIIFELKNHFPFEEKEMNLDWEIIPQEDTKQSLVLATTAPKNICNMYTYLFESVGLATIGLESQSLAMSRCLVTQKKDYQGEARALLDIGATHTNLVIYDNNSIQFSKTLSFSGELINTALIQKMKITHDEAEKIKRTLGFEYSAKYKKEWAIISKTFDILHKELAKTINFYYSHFPEANKITHITMCGGGAYIKRLPELLTEHIGIESMAGHVWKNLHTRKKQIPDDEALNYATAIGLALRASNNPYVKQKHPK
jgi:type IV pilus assembly protein PilM